MSFGSITSRACEPPIPGPPPQVCRVCNGKEDLRRCASCEVVWDRYRSGDHQAADWSKYKVVCKAALQSRQDDTIQQIRVVSIESVPDPSSGGCITCSLKPTSLRDSYDNYFALSYVWGDPAQTETILVDGHKFEATKNLVEALRHIAVVEPRSKHALWIDAICINQHDIPERNSQVALMGFIYSNAERVLCWLGPGDAASEAALGLVSGLGRDLGNVLDTDCDLSALEHPVYEDMASRLGPPDQHLVQHPVFTRRPYWSRIWTLQEVALASSCQFISGTSSCLMSDFDTVFDWVRRPDIWEAIGRGEVLLERSPLTWRLLAGVHRYYNISFPINVARGLRPSAGPLSDDLKELMGCLHLTGSRVATDPRDKLFGLAGLIRIGIDIDYTLSAPDLYVKFSSYVANNISDLTSLLHHAGILSAATKLGLPSWVPDWSVPPSTFSKYEAYIGVYGANKGFPPEAASISVAGRTLSAKGIRLDTVRSMTPAKQGPADTHEEFEASLSRDIQFLLQCDARTVLQEILPGPPSSRLYATGGSMVAAVILLLLRDQGNVRPIDWAEAVASLVGCLVSDEPELRSAMGSSTSPLAEVEERLSRVCAFRREEELDWEEILRDSKRLLDDPLFRHPVLRGSGNWGDVLFRTSGGYVGRSWAGIQEGDAVYILGSCSMPVILRKVGDGFTFLSQCILTGAMHGEAWAMAENMGLALEELDMK
ncbi:hypothetical protein DL765_006770 [Monosporascus sp. GIB2]|nr:hypothetical protein DL765_006770 [Monosporascus sp. GIB2]